MSGQKKTSLRVRLQSRQSQPSQRKTISNIELTVENTQHPSVRRSDGNLKQKTSPQAAHLPLVIHLYYLSVSHILWLHCTNITLNYGGEQLTWWEVLWDGHKMSIYWLKRPLNYTYKILPRPSLIMESPFLLNESRELFWRLDVKYRDKM